MIIDNKEQMTYIGGGTISAALINAFLSGIKFIYSVGQEIGTSIYRYVRKTSC